MKNSITGISGCLFCLLMLPLTVLSAHEIIETEYGNVFVVTFKEYSDRTRDWTCHELPGTIRYKAFQSQDEQNFTPAEYRKLAGDAPYLGLRNYESWYDKQQRKYVGAEQLFEKFGPFHSGKWDNLPILCGAKDASVIARKKKEQQNTSANNPFHGLAGAKYLNLIYTGDFTKQDELGWTYLRNMRKNSQEDLAMGVVLSNVTSALSGREMDLTLLEEITMYYLKRTNEREASCFDPGAIKTTFTYRFPALIYNDGYTIPASTVKYEYVVNAKFSELCDRMCEREGMFYVVAHSMSKNSAKLEIADLFRGLDQMIRQHDCRSPIIKQFEANLIRFNAMEQNLPSNVRRNTLKAALDTPRL